MQNRFKYVITIAFPILLFLLSGIMVAQDQSTGTRSHEIGMLWETMFETGSLPTYAPLQDQMTYPGGDFDNMTRKNMAGRGLWIGVSNWTNKDNTPYPTYVSAGGFENNAASGFTFKISNKKRVRNRLPIVIVNDVAEVRLLDGRGLSTKSSSIPADERIETIWSTNVGIRVRMRSHAYANHNHNSYIIKEYLFTNDGNADGDDTTIELPGQNLTGVYFGFQYYFIPSGDRGYVEVNQHDDWAAYYGNSPGDTLRGLFYLYDGNSNVRSSSDDVGDPEEISGEFLSPQYPGFGVLHADVSTVDQSDDPNQPSTVTIKPRSTFAQPLAPPIGNDDMYTELRLGQQFKGSTEDRAAHPYDSNVIEPVGLLSFGPYDIPFGESINIVVYDVVGALSVRECINAGRDWKNGNLEWNGLSGDAG